MTEKLRAAFLAADRLPPYVQDELAERIEAEVTERERPTQGIGAFGSPSWQSVGRAVSGMSPSR
jgi:hypothetical protein